MRLLYPGTWRRATAHFAVAFVMLIAAAGLANAASPAASAFTPFPTSDIFMSPQFSSGVLQYVLTLGPLPTLTSGPYTYNITQVWGFYAVNSTGNGANDITTTSGNAIGAWTFDTNPNSPPVEVTGWTNSNKSESILPGGSKSFDFTQFTFDGVTPAVGLHVSLDLAGQPSPFASGNTGSILPTVKFTTPPPVIPEVPTALLGTLGVAASALLRRFRGLRCG